MASEKNITMRQYNGVDYDTLYSKTKIDIFSLQFDILPKILIIPWKYTTSHGLAINNTQYSNTEIPRFLFNTEQSYKEYTLATAFGHRNFIKIENSTFSWYSTYNNQMQSNLSGCVYYWVTIF